MYVGMYVCMYVCVYVCMFVCVYVMKKQIYAPGSVEGVFKARLIHKIYH